MAFMCTKVNVSFLYPGADTWAGAGFAKRLFSLPKPGQCPGLAQYSSFSAYTRVCRLIFSHELSMTPTKEVRAENILSCVLPVPTAWLQQPLFLWKSCCQLNKLNPTDHGLSTVHKAQSPKTDDLKRNLRIACNGTLLVFNIVYGSRIPLMRQFSMITLGWKRVPLKILNSDEHTQ